MAWAVRREWKGSGTQGRMDLGKQRMWGSFPPLTHTYTHTHKGEAPSSLAPSSATLQLPPPPHMHTTERGGKRHASVHAMPISLSLVKGRNWSGRFANHFFCVKKVRLRQISPPASDFPPLPDFPLLFILASEIKEEEAGGWKRPSLRPSVPRSTPLLSLPPLP